MIKYNNKFIEEFAKNAANNVPNYNDRVARSIFSTLEYNLYLEFKKLYIAKNRLIEYTNILKDWKKVCDAYFAWLKQLHDSYFNISKKTVTYANELMDIYINARNNGVTDVVSIEEIKNLMKEADIGLKISNVVEGIYNKQYAEYEKRGYITKFINDRDGKMSENFTEDALNYYREILKII